MKKIVLLVILVLFISGCTSIQNSSLEQIVDSSLNSKMTHTNVNRSGYNYYLPQGLSVKDSSSFNEVLTDQKYLYYLYVDVVSYNHQTPFSFEQNYNAYYSANINNKEKRGFIEINNYKNNQYLIEIMYNYAKIEVVVNEEDINLSVSYAMVLLSSITYNDNVIASLLSENILEFSEEDFDIFEIVGRDDYLEFKEETTTEDINKDPDYIK